MNKGDHYINNLSETVLVIDQVGKVDGIERVIASSRDVFCICREDCTREAFEAKWSPTGRNDLTANHPNDKSMIMEK